MTFPKVVRALDLGAYGPEYEGLALGVWVNPPREIRETYVQVSGDIRDLVRVIDDKANEAEHLEKLKAASTRMLDWLAIVLGQGEEETRCSREQLEELADASPGLYGWILHSAYWSIMDYRANKKKG